MNSTENTPSNSELWLTSDVAKFLRLHPRAIFNLRKKGFPYLQVGGAIRFDPQKVKDYLNQTPRLRRHQQRQRVRQGEAL